MPGHISYPRTAAEANAESDYEQAITLANGGEADRAKVLLRDILDNPYAPPWLKGLAEKLLTKLNVESIQIALTSSDKDTRLEGEVGKFVSDAGFAIRGFNQEFGPNGSDGEIDIETTLCIIEVTNKSKKKHEQIKYQIHSLLLNPHKKKVILFAPKYGNSAEKNVIKAGGIVVRTLDALVKFLY